MEACKTQRFFAQDALVRIGVQEGFHQYRKAWALRFSPARSSARFVNFWQQGATFTVGQEAVVTHHFKVSGQDMADVTPQHLLQAQFLAFVLLGVVVVRNTGERLRHQGNDGTATPPPAAVSGRGPDISRCAKPRGSFWLSALSSAAGIAPGSASTASHRGCGHDPAGKPG